MVYRKNSIVESCTTKVTVEAVSQGDEVLAYLDSKVANLVVAFTEFPIIKSWKFA